MSEDPYARFMEAIKPEERNLDSIGRVISVAPLRIKIGDLEIDKDNILINPSLLQRKEKIVFDTHTETSGTHTHQINIDKEEIELYYDNKIDLAQGEEVLIIRNDQWFIIVCKVVTL